MSDTPSFSRPPGPIVAPIEHNGIQYEQRHGAGYAVYLSATNMETGEEIWRVKVYPLQPPADSNIEKIPTFFQSMKFVDNHQRIEIENEVGGRYLVDLMNQTSTWIESSTPEIQKNSAKPKPKPKPMP